MPEVRAASVRVRISVALEEYERWQALAVAVGLPVEALIGVAASRALPGYEQRLSALSRPEPEVAGGLDAAGHAAASVGGEAAGRALNEDRPAYSSVPHSQRGAGGAKKKRR